MMTDMIGNMNHDKNNINNINSNNGVIHNNNGNSSIQFNNNNLNSNNNNNNNDNGNFGQDKEFSGNHSGTENPIKSSYDTDVIRLIGQHLAGMGMKQTVELLLRESGVHNLDHPLAVKLRHSILNGQWDVAQDLVKELVLHCYSDERNAILREMQLLIVEQKFLELIEDEQNLKALNCLRNEITPVYVASDNYDKIQQFASLLFNKSSIQQQQHHHHHEVKDKIDLSNKRNESRKNLLHRLQKYIPTLMMLPSNRLQTLLSQAVQLQKEKCLLHVDYGSNELDKVDLKADHVCKADNIPIDCRQVIDTHKGEIWFCQFSHDGSKLATGGQGGIIKIWDVDIENYKLTERCQFDNHGPSINCLSWSPNDEFLLTCLSDSKPGLNLWNVSRALLEKSISFTEDQWSTSCSWHPSGSSFAAGSIKGNFILYDADGNITGQREGIRVVWLSFLNKDDKTILAADNLHRIASYRVDDMMNKGGIFESDFEIQERRPITSFVIDNEDKLMAVNLSGQGVHLWDLKERSLLKIFSQPFQSTFVIHSSFSGGGAFLATGSENGRVYIFNVMKDDPVAILHGHSRSANSVSWNPKYPNLLVSVGDDRLIRVWGPPKSSSVLSSSVSVAPTTSGLTSTDVDRNTRSSTTALGKNANFIYNELIIGQE